jgi:hypothetical protein
MGAVVLGYVVEGQETLVRMGDGSPAHIAPDLAALVGEIGRLEQGDLPIAVGGGVDHCAVVEEGDTLCHDSECVTDLAKKVKGSDGRAKKARPSKRMQDASAEVVFAALRQAGAVEEVGGVAILVGGIAYGHAEP